MIGVSVAVITSTRGTTGQDGQQPAERHGGQQVDREEGHPDQQRLLPPRRSHRTGLRRSRRRARPAGRTSPRCRSAAPTRACSTSPSPEPQPPLSLGGGLPGAPGSRRRRSGRACATRRTSSRGRTQPAPRNPGNSSAIAVPARTHAIIWVVSAGATFRVMATVTGPSTAGGACSVVAVMVSSLSRTPERPPDHAEERSPPPPVRRRRTPQVSPGPARSPSSSTVHTRSSAASRPGSAHSAACAGCEKHAVASNTARPACSAVERRRQLAARHAVGDDPGELVGQGRLRGPGRRRASRWRWPW